MLIEDMQNEKAGIPTEFNQYNISGSYQPQQHNHKEKKPITRMSGMTSIMLLWTI